MIKAKNIKKEFIDGEKVTKVLKGIDLWVKPKEFISIMGRSGAGKSTLLYQISLLDNPTEGEIFVDGIDVSKLNNREKTLFRLNNLGFIFQDYALLPELTAVENVMLPVIMQSCCSKKEARERAQEALNKLGLGGRYDNLPSQLSGGEQQRVSIARAISHKPKILFADEPTANLDKESAERVIDSLVELHKSGQTIIMVTHEEEYGSRSERILRMEDGLVFKEDKLK